MPSVPPIPPGQKTILAAVRSAVEAAGGKRIGIHQFTIDTKIRKRDIYRHYSCWNEALTAAGYHFQPWHEPIPPEVLLADWGRVARKLGHPPNLKTYRINGSYDDGTFRKRFGSWINACRAFRKFAAGKPEWADVLSVCPPIRPGAKSRGPLGKRRPRLRRAGRPIYGLPLNLPGLGYAPVTESGVIFLFGILAWRLGFQIEAIRPAFPDCEAKRQVAPGVWQDVAIEFEYESRSFRDHGHPADGCDIIVCWTHNWPECPRTIEVIALSREIDRIRDQGIRVTEPDPEQPARKIGRPRANAALRCKSRKSRVRLRRLRATHRLNAQKPLPELVQTPRRIVPRLCESGKPRAAEELSVVPR